jgi:uncharacterized membrane protein YfcA
MIGWGIEVHAAVATNMLALTFMSIGGSLGFIRSGVISRTFLPACISVTAVGSGLGALLLLAVPVRALQLIVAGCHDCGDNIHAFETKLGPIHH